MITWIYLLLWTSLVSSQAVYLPDTEDISIEKPEESEEKCFKYNIIPIDTESSDMAQVFYLACRSLAITNVRSKRFIQPIVDFIKNTVTKKVIVSKMNRSEIHAKANDLYNLLREEKLGGDVTVREFQELTNWNATVILSDFRYPPFTEGDAWDSTQKFLSCDPFNHIELKLCGRVGPRYNWAGRKFIVPLVRFDATGSIMKYIEMPKYIAVVHGHMSLIKTCTRLLSLSVCTLETAKTCSPFDTTLCNTTLKVEESKVFIRDYGEWTVVASFFENYTTFIDGKMETHAMDASRHVALRLPYSSWARFGNVTVYGHALHDYDHFPIYVGMKVPPVNTDDIDSLEKQYGKWPILAESRKMILSKQSGHSPELLFVAIFLLCSFFIIASVLLVLLCHRHKRNQKDHKEKPEGGKVVYANGNCEIVI
uniref:Glycoprotein n=1 Tax=Caenorhabditis tropicalis TaxID=1561998 RepID=A0A1I7UAI4_9PELO